MLESLLSEDITAALNKYDEKHIYEIRIRDDKPVKINCSGRYIELFDGAKPLIAARGTCNKIVTKACDYSLYSVNNQIVQGYIAVERGIRIGLCGEIVRENNGVKTVKNFSSLNIRIPHDAENCSSEVFGYVYSLGAVRNTLIIAPPGKGKTTMLRDLTRKISRQNLNVLVVDERNEICAVNGGIAYYKTGDNCDVITFGSKDFAFSYGIRTMAPDVIVTDEIMSEEDALAVLMAMGGGVRVLASAHAHSPEEFKTKPFLKLLLSSKCIERYVFLSAKEIGKVAGVYDREFGRIK